jgi:hypothetical protein
VRLIGRCGVVILRLSGLPGAKNEREKMADDEKTNAVRSEKIMCGSTTVAGTPCSRHVVGPWPCWQHGYYAHEYGYSTGLSRYQPAYGHFGAGCYS